VTPVSEISGKAVTTLEACRPYGRRSAAPRARVRRCIRCSRPGSTVQLSGAGTDGEGQPRSVGAGTNAFYAAAVLSKEVGAPVPVLTSRSSTSHFEGGRRARAGADEPVEHVTFLAPAREPSRTSSEGGECGHCLLSLTLHARDRHAAAVEAQDLPSMHPTTPWHDVMSLVRYFTR
jgi:hypothetical protein